MKTNRTTLEQSKMLLDAGLPEYTADIKEGKDIFWSTERLLKLLPEKINPSEYDDDYEEQIKISVFGNSVKICYTNEFYGIPNFESINHDGDICSALVTVIYKLLKARLVVY